MTATHSSATRDETSTNIKMREHESATMYTGGYVYIPPANWPG
jgi:hypothetical protein